MIKIQIGYLLDGRTLQMFPDLDHFLSTKTPHVGLNYDFSRLRRVIMEEIESFYQERNTVLVKYSTEKEFTDIKGQKQRTFYKLKDMEKPDSGVKYQEPIMEYDTFDIVSVIREVDQLLTHEIELQAKKISLKLLIQYAGDTSSLDFDYLEPFIEDDRENK